MSSGLLFWSDPSGLRLILKPCVLSRAVIRSCTLAPCFTRMGDGLNSYFFADTSMTCMSWSSGEVFDFSAKPAVTVTPLSKSNKVVRNIRCNLSPPSKCESIRYTYSPSNSSPKNLDLRRQSPGTRRIPSWSLCLSEAHFHSSASAKILVETARRFCSWFDCSRTRRSQISALPILRSKSLRLPAVAQGWHCFRRVPAPRIRNR